MKKLLSCAILFVSVCSHAAEYMVSVPSKHSVADTADNFEHIIKHKGLTVFNRINHAKNARQVGMQLSPSEVIVFGNPKMGTQLMQCQPSVAIDLPLKVMVWQDHEKKVWLSYDDPASMQSKHRVQGCDAVFKKMSHVLHTLTNKAAQ